jgi:hypothetical protein
VIVLAADLGQSEGLDYAGQEDIQMIDAVSAGLHLVTVAQDHEVVGELSLHTKGSGTGPKSVPVETASTLFAVGWPGSNVVISIRSDRMGESVHSGTQVGFLEASSAGGTPTLVPLTAVASLHQ